MCFSVENSVDEIYWITRDMRVIYANERACSSMGYSLDEILSKKVDELRPENEAKRLKNQWNEIFSGKKSYIYETYHKRSDGSTYPVESHASYFRSDVLKFSCIYSRDITDRKKYEGKLKQSEKEKTLILNTIHENLVFYDCNFKIIWANKDPADSLNMKPEDLVGKICYKLWYNRDSPCEGCTVLKAINTKKPLVEEKTRSGGKRINVKVAAYPVFDENNQVIGAVESVLDISKRKKAEKALEISEKQYKELFSTMNNGFVLHKIITDENGIPCDYRFLEINPAFEKMTGLKAQDIRGKTFFELYPDEDKKSIERYGKIALSGIPEEFTEYNSIFGKYYKIYSYSPRKNQFAAIFTDITDIISLKKHQKQSLQQIEKNLEQLAILNDEIRNPLQTIIGYIMLGDFKYTSEVLEQTKVIDRLVNRLDQQWLESQKIRDFLRKHYNFD
ncbi:PAS domain S-box-containing protein [Methanomicrobium sp. W14]|uniref:PAS domain S-box protein n=1 Tax=Methanomicrobium sp. W14 TaxID=2817839 RepID=UPI001AE3B4A5|nr:PAS domain S-box protein [Methanomicrobium sp. W14]MBP2132672.1 PAS domain S-box-containing protein [Methanomicrobium sp. W14]